MQPTHYPLSNDACRRARLARDPRFDGKFFVGVLTTGIFCRPICPAVAPKEQNVRYFASAIAAANAGLRPCLRCRPDSAPDSYAWKGVHTSLERALHLIEQGALRGDSGRGIEALAARLGISSRYMRQLFVDNLGTSPKKYAQFCQLMFAKQLLHQTQLSITQVAFAAGFNSVRRFNELFKDTLKLTPSALRKVTVNTQIFSMTSRRCSEGEAGESLPKSDGQVALSLFLSYRPPYNWAKQLAFYQLRMVEGMEWRGDPVNVRASSLSELSYGRSFELGEVTGYFEASHQVDKHGFKVNIHLASSDDLHALKDITWEIRRLLDLNADMAQIEAVIGAVPIMSNQLATGLRLPGTWSVFEAGCRAVLGQQVSLTQATKLLNTLVKAYGKTLVISGRTLLLFPTADVIAKASLDELKMPTARKATLRALAQFINDNPDAAIDDWLAIKGIGPWTVAYAKMRDLSNPDILLCSDLVVKKRILALSRQDEGLPDSASGSCVHSCLEDRALADGESGHHKSRHHKLEDHKPEYYKQLIQQLGKQASPWGSYLTFQLWDLA